MKTTSIYRYLVLSLISIQFASITYAQNVAPDTSTTFDPRTPVYQNTITPGEFVGSSRVDLQACKLEYSIVSPK